MKTKRFYALIFAVALVVGGCGGTGGGKSTYLTFSMEVLQIEGEYLIHGTVYNDLNGDGNMDAIEPGVPGAIVTLVGIDAATTASDGMFAFSVSAGAYTLHETDPAGYTSITPNEVSVVVENENYQADFVDYMEPGLPVDVKPGSDVNPLNLKSKGVLPVAILGSETFDVTQIDPASLRLNGVAPLRWSYGDVGGGDNTAVDPDVKSNDEEMSDGYDDMTLKFSTQEIAAALGNDLERGDIVALTMTGSLNDSSSIWGEEMVWIVQIPK